MQARLKQFIKDKGRELSRATNPDSDKTGLDSTIYETAVVALGALEGRQLTIAYVLGIAAGVRLDVHSKIPSDPFAADSNEADDFATGVMDAIAVSIAYREAK